MYFPSTKNKQLKHTHPGNLIVRNWPSIKSRIEGWSANNSAGNPVKVSKT